MNDRAPDLGELEREVMQLVWSAGETTADAIRERLARKPKESTVRTVLRRLEEKGYVTHTVDGRTYVFRAAAARPQVAARGEGNRRLALQRIGRGGAGGYGGRAHARQPDVATTCKAHRAGKRRKVMLEVVVRAAICTLLLAVAVQLCLRTLRVRHPKLLLSAWTAVLVASVAKPALQRAIPSAAPTLLSRSFSAAGIVNSNAPASLLPLSMISSSLTSLTISPSGATTARASEPQRTFAWRKWLTGTYVLVASLFLLRLLLGLILSWRMLRATHPVRENWAAGKRLRTSTWICAPVTVGSQVLLPAECVNWDARRRRAVLAHEEAHIARGDFYVQLLSQVNRSVFWFSPLAWWLHRRLTALAELASDDAAIEALGDRPGYAAILLDVARLPRTLVPPRSVSASSAS